MTLIVSSEDFVDSVKRYSDSSFTQRAIYYHGYRLPQGGEGYRLTFAAPDKHVLIMTDMLVGGRGEFDDYKTQLTSAGYAVVHGIWTDRADTFSSDTTPGGDAQAYGPDDEPPAKAGKMYVGAIAYLTADGEAGIWVDAFPTQPSEDDVLRAMYNEFVSSGDLAGTNFSDFVSGSSPTVEIIDQDDINGWIMQKLQR